MEEKFIKEILDVLVRMSDHCKKRESTDNNSSKCINCGMVRDFGYSNSGCLLVDILDNTDFVDVLVDTCKYQNIEYIDKLNEIMDIFITEYE